MRAVIIGNGDFYDEFEIKENDYIICADGGMNHAVKYNINPDILIGDMDSVNDGCDFENTVVYPCEKNETDGELAVSLAMKKGCDEVVMLGFTGNRLDHTAANICLLRVLCNSGIKAFITDKNNTVYYIKSQIELDGVCGKTISVIPLFSDMTGVCTKGLYYPLNKETLYFGKTRGISNKANEDKIEITVESGEGIVVVTNGE